MSIGQKMVVRRYNPIRRNFPVIATTTDINEMLVYIRIARTDKTYRINFDYPGADYGTYIELKWCDTVAEQSSTPSLLNC